MTEFNADLVDDLARQRVVLFLGAGVTASAVTRSGGRMKGWEAFLRACLSEVGPELKAQIEYLLDRKDFLLACELLQSSIGDRWPNLVRTEFNQMAEPSPLHAALISLAQRIILTTNFDKLIDTCWESKIGAGTHLPVVLNSIEPTIFNLLKDHSNKYLVKIHGSVDNTETLIFSRSEYIRLAFGNIVYSSFLEMLLLNYTFLFVGFSMEDPAIYSLMELYALRYPKARPHYLFAPKGVPDNILEINLRLRKLKIMQYDPSDGHAALPTLVNELAEAAQKRRRELLAYDAARSI